MRNLNILLILVVFTVCCSSCKKDPDVQLGQIKIIEKEKQFSKQNDSISVNVLSEYSYSGIIDKITIKIGLSEDFSDAEDHVAFLGGKDFNITISGLALDTVYYYKYCVNRYSVEFGNETVWEEDTTRILYTDHLQFVPFAVTQSVLNITQNDAIGCGFVANTGTSEITDCGICWSSNGIPSIEHEHSSIGTTIGDFSVLLNNLTKETTYYMRAYAENAFGVGYGEIISFNTKSSDLEGLSVMTLDATINDSGILTFYGKATDLNYNGSVHTDTRNYGFYYGLSPDTDLAIGATNVSTFNDVTNYSSSRSFQVNTNTKYYYRAYAIDYRTGDIILGQLKSITITGA